jgi:hypothetical protein
MVPKYSREKPANCNPFESSIVKDLIFAGRSQSVASSFASNDVRPGQQVPQYSREKPANCNPFESSIVKDLIFGGNWGDDYSFKNVARGPAVTARLRYGDNK